MYDPLGLIETRDMRRYEIMELKSLISRELQDLHINAPLQTQKLVRCSQHVLIVSC